VECAGDVHENEAAPVAATASIEERDRINKLSKPVAGYQHGVHRTWQENVWQRGAVTGMSLGQNRTRPGLEVHVRRCYLAEDGLQWRVYCVDWRYV